MPRRMTACTSSGRVQWLRCSGGFSQATAKIWQICSGVNVPGQPGRGLSASKTLTASRNCLGVCSSFFKPAQPCTQRFRHEPTVSSHHPKSLAMALLVCPWLAPNTILARCTKPCGTSRLLTMEWRSLSWSGDRLIGLVGRAIGSEASKKMFIIQPTSSRVY